MRTWTERWCWVERLRAVCSRSRSGFWCHSREFRPETMGYLGLVIIDYRSSRSVRISDGKSTGSAADGSYGTRLPSRSSDDQASSAGVQFELAIDDLIDPCGGTLEPPKRKEMDASNMSLRVSFLIFSKSNKHFVGCCDGQQFG